MRYANGSAFGGQQHGHGHGPEWEAVVFQHLLEHPRVSLQASAGIVARHIPEQTLEDLAGMLGEGEGHAWADESTHAATASAAKFDSVAACV